jgi:mannose-6-phosphate isomerase
VCVGTFAISYESVTDYKKGDTVLIPAAMKSYLLSGKASILEIYIS